MGKKTSKAPPPPDPQQVAAQQGALNRQTTDYTQAANRGNTTTPLGSQTFASRRDPTTGATQWDETVALAPDAQVLFDQQMRQNRDVGDVAQGVLPRVASTYSQPMSMEGLPKAYGADDLLGARKESQDALYNQYSSYLDPQYANRERALSTDLANKGIVEGSEAYQNARADLGRDRAFDYNQARTSAVAGGGAEESRLYGMSSDARARALAERLMTRSQPLDEFERLRGDANVDLPQFSQPSDVGLQGTDITSPIYNSYQGQVNVANANAQRKNDAYTAWLNLIGNVVPGG